MPVRLLTGHAPTRHVRGLYAFRKTAPWFLGVAAALVVLGPGLAPGSLLNLDLILTPRLQVPTGVWGLGPELPRLVPIGAPMAWASTIAGGPFVGKALIVVALAVAFVGAFRLAVGAGALAATGAGAIYAFGPFMLTRVGVGHLTLVAAAALLPWALPTLLRPSVSVRRTLAWSLALGFTGFAGALLAAPALAVGLVADGPRRWGVILGGFLVAQSPWLVPSLVIGLQPSQLAKSSHFAADAHGVDGFARVLAGYGFWDPAQQVSLRLGAFAACAGVALFGLAVVGTPLLPAVTRSRAPALAAIGLLGAIASAIPLIRDVANAIGDTGPGSIVRESQRLLPLYLVWLAPAAALGAHRLADRCRPALDGIVASVPLAIALVLAGPALWGINGRLDPVRFPAVWAQAHAEVARAPGPLLALPYHEYLDLSFAGNRRVLNPVPSYFGGDVLVAADPEFEEPANERTDPREPAAHKAVADTLLGKPPSRELRSLGVRWVLLLHEVDWHDYRALREDNGLQPVLRTRTLELYQVRGWKGLVVDKRGRPVAIKTPVRPLAVIDGSQQAIWYRPAANGWLRGLRAAREARIGTLQLPGGPKIVWYWPTIPVLAGDVAAFARLRSS